VTESRSSRWLRRLAVAALVLLGLAIVAWRVGVRVLERTPIVDETAPVVSCLGTLDPAYAASAARARRHLRATLIEREIPGITIGVAVGGRLVWSEGLGYANRETRAPACPSMQFRLQSVSKLITTAGMMRLVERGVLDLDAPVSHYVPDLPAALGAVTARQLASHRAGVRHYRDDNESLNTTKYETARESLERFKDDPLLFPPDSRSTYSTYGFVLLGAAMEGASGIDFPALIRREVFEPLDMMMSDAERSNEPGTARVTFYDHVTPYSLDGDEVVSPTLDFSSKWAGGGLLSTAEDLTRFATVHFKPYNRRFLTDESLDVIFTPRTTQFVVFGQALGWVVARDHRFRRLAAHFGAGSGGSSFFAIYPARQVGVAVLANLGHANFSIPRLFGIVNPFVGDPLGPLAWLGCAAAFAAALVVWRRSKSRP